MGESEETDQQDDSARSDEAMLSSTAHMRAVHGRTLWSVAEIPTSGVIVGRANGTPGVDLVLDDRRMSRRHIRIEAGALGWHLVDIDSRNGGFVDGRAFAPGARVILVDGAVIRIGDSLLVFRASALAPPDEDDRMFPGDSSLAVVVRGQLRRLAATTGHVLIHGETGTGKERAALFVGTTGAPHPFIAVNCAELTRDLARSELFGHVRGAFSGAHVAKGGLVEAAGSGVLFLDEVGELPLDVQGDLLRFLEDGHSRPIGSTELRRSSARVIAATNVDLDDAVRTGRFRRDLLARLRASNAPVELPPLRRRREDILGWARRFAREADASHPDMSFTAGAAECLLLYPWLENLRELRGLVRSLIAEQPSEPISSERLPAHLRTHRKALRDDGNQTKTGSAPATKEPTREEIETALQETDGKMRTAAQLLHIDRRKLYRLCERYGIDLDGHRRGERNGRSTDA
ncbi:sigma 54-interacting transcriptional regulator [Pendulispora albinea]|uniref:Sigma 54-interacting transcriptional regulator n=1 Tax=Pendulispora albinea TaxID=2741071 RepID=A0ABZ2LNU3_9BACT